MNDKLNNFISNMGVLCETWLVTYNQFIAHGLEHKAAIEHTKSFMSTFIKSFNENKGSEQ